MFEPIAIVGRGCVLPDALSPSALWDNVVAGRVSLRPVPGTDPPARGGHVRGFEKVFDPAGFLIDQDDLISLDPLFHWAMHCGREALREAGMAGPLPRAGLILGNLGYPSHGMSRYAEHVWARSLRAEVHQAVAQGPDRDPRRLDPDPRNRFSCGLAAHLTARALGLGGGSLGLDAACASSLYAIKIAVDRLHDGSADVMLAAAVNRSDDLFLRAGFGALQAISPTGRSRPFHRGADGLVPAEGAACVALMRLADATRADVPVLAVIRGIGLSNAGRGQGLLAPCQESQERAVLAAYRAARVPPASVALLECHATGTRLGDAVEVRGAAKVFADVRDLPVGSVKSNLGHPVTVAGLAGLLKLIGALHAGVRPATLGADEHTDALDGTPLRPLQENEPWEGPRRAGLNTFGFGGNNAHLVLDGWPSPAGSVRESPRPAPDPDPDPGPIAIVAIGTRVGDGRDEHDFADALLGGKATDPRRDNIETPLAGLRFPPSDLKQAHAQQLLILDAARAVVAGRRLPRERTMVLIGMGCDAEVARYTAGLRGPSWPARPLPDGFSPPLTAAGVVGTMPNIVANRLNSQFDLAGPGFSVFAEEASGLAALELGCRALRADEADVVMVGAVDLSCEPVHEASLQAMGHARPPGDAAVVLLLRRLPDAERDGDDVIALVDDSGSPGTEPGLRIGPGAPRDGIPSFDPVTRFGSPHAAEGLVAVAAAALAVRHRAVPRTRGPADPLLGEALADVTAEPLGTAPARVRIRGAAPASWSAGSYSVHLFRGRDRQEVAAALHGDRDTSATGPCRLALVERPGDDLADRREAARRWLTGQGERPAATAFRTTPLDGEIAFVYTNGSACHPAMGRSLMLGFPDVMDEIKSHCGPLAEISEPVLAGRPTTPVQRNLAATLLADLHTRLTRDRLGIRPDAVLGYSSGEGSAMVALRLWQDVPAFVTELIRTGVFTHGLIGEQRIPRRAWRRMALPDDRWVNLLVAAPAERVRAALQDERAAHLLVVNAPDSCVIGGAADACERVTRSLGGSVVPTGYDIAAHTPVLNEAHEELWRLYNRPVHAEGPTRFYTGTSGTAYVPTSKTVADALTTLTLSQVDFARTVRTAWNDGVRIFIEHGPGGLCSGWISTILQDRDHLAVPLDGEDSCGRLVQAIAELAAAGVSMKQSAVLDQLTSASRTAAQPPHTVVTPAHPPPVADRADALITRQTAPSLDRTQLERLASGRPSDILGERFTALDDRARRTRLPEPPMLLVDRVAGIDAEPCSLGKGTIRTETDIDRDAWYLDGSGRMPAGLLMAAGQGDRLLLTWLGADLHVAEDRVYRLLGCDLTFHASPPQIGETLTHRISVDGHGTHDGVPLFFFNSRCEVGGRPKLTVSNAQAGYFTDDELTASQGVPWDPTGTAPPRGRVDAPPIVGSRTSFDCTRVRAFSEGRPDRCFGPGWEGTRAHLRPPRIGNGRMQLLHRVCDFDPQGGPWQRGYLRAEFAVSPQEWFFRGHFPNDPYMPEALMHEACLQAMAFYLAALGFTIDRDGWRFEPVPAQTCRLRFRGQVTPASRSLTYEIFVSEVAGGPRPVLYADALCTVDGVKALHARRLGLRLVPDWPFEHWSRLGRPAAQHSGEPVPPERLGGLVGHRQDPATVEDRRHDYPALLASAWGTPAHGREQAAVRLPGPPYLFLSRVSETGSAFNGTGAGAGAVAEYDLPSRAWYWRQNGFPTTPLAVLLEIALQPCAWLIGRLELPAAARPGIRLRNLGGSASILGELFPASGGVRTNAQLTGVRDDPDATVLTFEVTCRTGDQVLRLDTEFGLLAVDSRAWRSGALPSALEQGPPPQPHGDPIDLRTRPRDLFGGRLRLAGSMLLMIDRLTGWWPDGGAAGLGRVRTETDVDPADWYFKAHLFQDPVLPGSLALEAMAQTLQLYMIESGLHTGVRDPRFEPFRLSHAVTWKHRGQADPGSVRVTIDLEIVSTGADPTGPYAVADAWLWADGVCICEARGMGMRIVPRRSATSRSLPPQ
ncbi:beta-ketoacyl synthase N-terminal-like domain-containing protein [Spirillospora sp. NPDC048911]|uniref:beta-ketoacyl synthase N-terminal-like domain-containing protein n=1 Tax=Spirillospora sp. NPDC048911 TaxID=3364527 RepID=UPI00371B5341